MIEIVVLKSYNLYIKIIQELFRTETEKLLNFLMGIFLLRTLCRKFSLFVNN